VNLRLVDDDKEQLAYTQVSVTEEPLLYIFLCILRDLPQQKIPRELCGGGDHTIFLHSFVPMERFFNGMDQENSKTQGGKGQIRKIQKNKKERMEERKRRDFYNLEVPILVCSPLMRNALWLPPSCDPPSGEPTHMGNSLTT